MESVGFTLNDFYLVIYPFQFSGVDGVIAVVKDTVSIASQRVCEFGHRLMVQSSCKGTPGINGLGCPGSGAVSPDAFELLLQNHHGADGFVERQQFLEVLALLVSFQVVTVF